MLSNRPVAYTFQRSGGAYPLDNTFFGSSSEVSQVHISETGETAIVKLLAAGSDGLWTRSGSVWSPAVANLESGTTAYVGSDVTDQALTVGRDGATSASNRAGGRLGCSSNVMRELSSSTVLCVPTPNGIPGQNGEPFPNSTGQVGEVNLSGNFTSSPMITITTTKLPNASFGFQMSSLDPGNAVVQGNSLLCLSGNIQRHFTTADNTGNNGTLDGTQSPPIDVSGFHVLSTMGTTVYFQTWHRDLVNGTPSSNFSDAVGVNLFL